MAYRNDVDALAARQASLHAELTAKQRELAETSQLLDDARERRRLPVLQNVRVASPCQAAWSAMTGDDRVRHCGDCKKSVYNLSDMTREEAEQLILGSGGGGLCIRYYQRADGTMLLADCSVGASRRVGRKVIAAGALAAGLVGGVGVSNLVEEATRKGPEKDDRVVMGEIGPGRPERIPIEIASPGYILGARGEPLVRQTALRFAPAANYGKTDQIGITSYGPDGSPDFVFDLAFDAPRPVKNLYVMVRGTNQQWDTIIQGPVPSFAEWAGRDAAATWHLGVKENGRWISRPDGTMPSLQAGRHELQLFANISVSSYNHFELIAELDDGSLLRATTRGPAQQPARESLLQRTRL
jgi:hypothetical protein